MIIHRRTREHPRYHRLPSSEDYSLDDAIFDRVQRDVIRALAQDEPADHLYAAGVDAFEIDLGNGGLVVQLLDLMRDTMRAAETDGDATAGALALERLRDLREKIVEWAQGDADAQLAALSGLAAEYDTAQEDAALDRAGK